MVQLTCTMIVSLLFLVNILTKGKGEEWIFKYVLPSKLAASKVYSHNGVKLEKFTLHKKLTILFSFQKSRGRNFMLMLGGRKRQYASNCNWRSLLCNTVMWKSQGPVVTENMKEVSQDPSWQCSETPCKASFNSALELAREIFLSYFEETENWLYINRVASMVTTITKN